MTVAELKDLIVNKLGIVKGCLHYDAIVEAVVFNYEYKPYRVDLYLNVTRLSGDVTDQSRQLEKLLRGEQWDGTGLPPVGTECEYEDSTGKWIHVEVVYKSDWVIVIRGKENNIGNGVEIAKDLVMDKLCRFRPLRTERDKAIEQMMSTPKPCGFAIQGICENLYDAIVAGKIDGLGKVG